MRTLREDAYIYKVASMRMSNKKMADVMYAMVITSTKLTSSLGFMVKQYDRKQNAYNNIRLGFQIPRLRYEQFVELSGLTLEEPEQVTLNHSNPLTQQHDHE